MIVGIILMVLALPILASSFYVIDRFEMWGLALFVLCIVGGMALWMVGCSEAL